MKVPIFGLEVSHSLLLPSFRKSLSKETTHLSIDPVSTSPTPMIGAEAPAEFVSSLFMTAIKTTRKNQLCELLFMIKEDPLSIIIN